MGLLKTISNIFREKKNEINDALKDPERDGKLAIEDSYKYIADFENKIATVMATNKKLEREYKDLKDKIKTYENVAKKAIEADNDEDATKALEQKVQIEKQANELKKQIDSNEKQITTTRENLSKARAKVKNAEVNHNLLVARNQGAEIRKKLAQAQSDFGNDTSNPLAALDDLEEAVNAAECEAEVYEELAAESQEGESLVDKYSVSDTAVDDELAKLKAKLGK